MSKYEAIAAFYDEFTENVDYDGLALYIDALFKRHGFSGNRILDVACGTGSLTLKLSEMGYDMIGVDSSEEMLLCAMEKCDFSPDLLWICQRAEELDLYGDVDGAVCTLDSINHITDKDALSRMMERVSLFMNEGGIFIFDVNTPYKHEKILGDNSFVLEDDGVFCAWQNEYEPKTGTVNMQLDFFCEDDGVYFRETQYISERAYTESELSDMLKSSGFELLAVYDERSFDEPKSDSQRIFYVAKNIKKQEYEF